MEHFFCRYDLLIFSPLTYCAVSFLHKFTIYCHDGVFLFLTRFFHEDFSCPTDCSHCWSFPRCFADKQTMIVASHVGGFELEHGSSKRWRRGDVPQHRVLTCPTIDSCACRYKERRQIYSCLTLRIWPRLPMVFGRFACMDLQPLPLCPTVATSKIKQPVKNVEVLRSLHLRCNVRLVGNECHHPDRTTATNQ